MWILVDGRTYFLELLEQGMTRGDVRKLARTFLDRHTIDETPR